MLCVIEHRCDIINREYLIILYKGDCNMLKNFEYIIKLFKAINQCPSLGDNYCIIFVYNSPQTMQDTRHLSECILEEELNMILTSFKKVAKHVYAIDGEEKFISSIHKYKKHFKHLLVYSMSQNLDGDGRRSLIPLLCDYYGLINIGANFISTVMGRTKDIMYSIIEPKGFIFPKTFYIYNDLDLDEVIHFIKKGIWLLKPNNESSSIGMQVHNFSQYRDSELRSLLVKYHKEYPVYCIQEFIDGEEVAVPILKIKEKYYCPGISQVKFPQGKNYIDYDMVALETYDYFEYNGNLKEKLFEISVNVAKTLKLTSMSRIDFRILNNTPYIEDIGANPTISANNGVNHLYCEYLQATPDCVYAVLVYTALIEHNLFKPPL